jgi:membrane protein
VRLFSFLKDGWEKISHLLGEDLGYFSASLSFYTVFSIIPMFWVVFFILSQFDAFNDYYQGIKGFLIINIMPTHTDSVSAYLDAFLENSKSMGLWGVVYITVASVMFYQNFQHVVNKIFFVANNSIRHAIETYLVLAVLMPITLGGSFLLSDFLQRIANDHGDAWGGYALVSFLMIWLLFFIVYKVAPNMRINYRVLIAVSFGIALLWNIAKMIFVYYVLVNQTYASLYGSFSVLLFFLLWIYISWFMLLHGLRLCYLMQCHIDH